MFRKSLKLLRIMAFACVGKIKIILNFVTKISDYGKKMF